MALDIAPAVVRKGEPVNIGRLAGGLGSSQLLKTVTYGGQPVVVNSWSSTVVNVTVPSGSSLTNSDTGYRFRIQGLTFIGAQESALIPLAPSPGFDYVEVAEPSTEMDSILRSFPDPVPAGSQIVFEETPGLTIANDGTFTFSPIPESMVQVPYFVIGPEGVIIGENQFSFSPGSPMVIPVLTRNTGPARDINLPNGRDADLADDIGG